MRISWITKIENRTRSPNHRHQFQESSEKMRPSKRVLPPELNWGPESTSKSTIHQSGTAIKKKDHFHNCTSWSKKKKHPRATCLQ